MSAKGKGSLGAPLEGVPKTCNKCNEKLLNTLEYFERKENGYLRGTCKLCINFRRRRKRNPLAERTKRKSKLIKINILPTISTNSKVCKHCCQILLNLKFTKKKNVCDDCHKEQSRKNCKKRLHSDSKYKLRIYTSNAIGRGLKRSNGSKLGKSIEQYLPYTIDELKTHIESLWEPWMSWENYGSPKKGERKWQIDHIIPQALLVYDSMEHPNFKKCWNLNNLRPLEAFENMKKHTSLINATKIT